MQKAYADYYVTKDIWASQRFPKHPPGTVVNGSMLVDRKSFLQSEHYNDFLKKQDIFYVCNLLVHPIVEKTAWMSVMRPRRRHEYDSSDFTRKTGMDLFYCKKTKINRSRFF